MTADSGIYPEAVRVGAIAAALETPGTVKAILADSSFVFNEAATTVAVLASECTGGTYTREVLDTISVVRDGLTVVWTANPVSFDRPGIAPAWIVLERVSDHLPLAYHKVVDDLADPVVVAFNESTVAKLPTVAAGEPVTSVAGVFGDAGGDVPTEDLANALHIPDGTMTTLDGLIPPDTGSVVEKLGSVDLFVGNVAAFIGDASAKLENTSFKRMGRSASVAVIGDIDPTAPGLTVPPYSFGASTLVALVRHSDPTKHGLWQMHGASAMTLEQSLAPGDAVDQEEIKVEKVFDGSGQIAGQTIFLVKDDASIAMLDSDGIAYTPADSSKWTGADPTNLKQAVDRLAAALGPIA